MQIESRTLESKLGTIIQVDPALRNLYVNTGYRLNYSVTDCFKSIFSFHNETMNIWTHLLSLIGLIIGGYIVMDNTLAESNDIDRTLLLVYMICTGLCLLLSLVYHTFGCLSRECHDRLLNCDLFGIALNITGSCLPIAYYGFNCDAEMQFMYICMILSIIPVGAIVAMYGAHPTVGLYIRTIGFCVLGAFGSFPLIHCYKSTPPDLIHIFNEGISGWSSVLIAYVSGVLIYIMKFPEKQYPKFTEYTSVSSHAIWHLAVTAGVALGMRQIYIHSQVAPNMSCEAWEAFRDLGHVAYDAYKYGQASMQAAPGIALKAAEHAAATAVETLEYGQASMKEQIDKIAEVAPEIVHSVKENMNSISSSVGNSDSLGEAAQVVYQQMKHIEETTTSVSTTITTSITGIISSITDSISSSISSSIISSIEVLTAKVTSFIVDMTEVVSSSYTSVYNYLYTCQM